MATTIQQSFQKLKENLEITGLQANTVSTRQNNVRDIVKKDLSVLDSFLTGSYSRSTMIAPLKEADVDIFVVLDSKYFHHYNNGQNGGQAGLLDLLKRTLRKTYTETPDISRNGQAVTIRFTDFMVDVVPAFNRQGGGYLIPNSVSQSWISTDPKKHVEIVTNSNKVHNGDFVPLVKMIKAWNKNNNKYFRSFHLEVLALSILNNVTISDYPSGTRFFFDKARDLITKQNPDPAGYGSDVGGYINTQEKIQEAVAKFELAYNRAIKAEDYASRGYVKDAIEMWIKIFGDYFPAYG
ncbi:MAG: CBASS oligonucleotide cyclase [Candidatus Pacebacteria bacterium]|nr:CBASS oligonucleotide cyclase [Candidatus Paceibacterota bacterium]